MTHIVKRMLSKELRERFDSSKTLVKMGNSESLALKFPVDTKRCVKRFQRKI